MNTIPVFVYRTLKRGHGNQRELEGATFLGEGHTVERYALHVQGLPMVDRNNPVSAIHGELYLVDRAKGPATPTTSCRNSFANGSGPMPGNQERMSGSC